MHLKMFLKIKNWKLAVLAFIMIGFLLRLGFWQLHRAHEKQQMLDTYHARSTNPPAALGAFNQAQDLRYRRASITGHFDNQHTFLLDNKIYKGQVGYEVFTLFQPDDINYPILIDRGFLPSTRSRNELPLVRPITGTTTINGMLNLPPGYVKFGQIMPDKSVTWPLRIEYLNLNEIEPFLNNRQLYPYIMDLAPDDPAAYPIEWQIVSLTPERHFGYAVQWFALALTLLILSVAINRNPS
jgi:surfeit locus 1 family protein